MPLGAEIPTACLVSVTEEISPSNGATTIPVSGRMPTPCPKTPAAKVSSGISSEGMTIPGTGAYTEPGWHWIAGTAGWTVFFSTGAALF